MEWEFLVPGMLNLALAVSGLLYPFRPKRFDRLWYASWQRQDTRRLEAFMLHPLAIAALLNAWVFLSASDGEYLLRPVYLTGFAVFAFWVGWGGMSILLAWLRRERSLESRGIPPILLRASAAAALAVALAALGMVFLYDLRMLGSPL